MVGCTKVTITLDKEKLRRITAQAKAVEEEGKRRKTNVVLDEVPIKCEAQAALGQTSATVYACKTSEVENGVLVGVARMVFDELQRAGLEPKISRTPQGATIYIEWNLPPKLSHRQVGDGVYNG